MSNECFGEFLWIVYVREYSDKPTRKKKVSGIKVKRRVSLLWVYHVAIWKLHYPFLLFRRITWCILKFSWKYDDVCRLSINPHFGESVWFIPMVALETRYDRVGNRVVLKRLWFFWFADIIKTPFDIQRGAS